MYSLTVHYVEAIVVLLLMFLGFAYSFMYASAVYRSFFLSNLVTLRRINFSYITYG